MHTWFDVLSAYGVVAVRGRKVSPAITSIHLCNTGRGRLISWSIMGFSGLDIKHWLTEAKTIVMYSSPARYSCQRIGWAAAIAPAGSLCLPLDVNVHGVPQFDGRHDAKDPPELESCTGAMLITKILRESFPHSLSFSSKTSYTALIIPSI